MVASSKALVLLDTNICIAREDPLLVKRNVRQLFEHLARLRVNYVVHPKTFDESSRGQKHEQKYFFISKLGCYPLLRSPPDPNNDDEFLNTVGRSSEKSDRVDNALLYAVYKGAVTCLITEDKAIRANAKKLRVKEKVISVDGALKILDQKSHFDNISFTWSEAFVDHTRDKVLGATVELVGRADEVNQLRSLIEDQNVRAIVISGLPGVGKTRITLKATEYRQDDVLAIAPPHPTSAEDLKRRIPQALDKEMLVIIDNADSKTAEALLDDLPRCTGMKLLITTDVADFICPNHGDACRTRTVVIFPLADQYSEELLRMAGARLGYNLESYWIPKIGGIPGVLLEAAVAQAQSRLKKEAAAVVRDKARACIKWARRTLGDNAVKRIQLLSVLERVGVEKVAFNEIKTVCEVFGSDIDALSVISGLELLERAGVIQRKGSHVEVLSPLLANGLTRELMLRHSYDFITLFKRLNLDGQERLLKRLQPVKVKQAELFWRFFFSAEGPFVDFQTTLANSNLLYPAARANPNRVSQLIDSGLRNTTISDRRAIFIAHRRRLAHALSVLLLNHRTYEKAANNLALLAEADTDSENSNATAYFCSYFYPHHPQVQSKFKTRTKQLEEVLFNQNKPIQLRKLGVTAISTSLEPMAVPLFLQPSDAAEPLKPPPAGIVAEMLDYMEGLIGLLMRTAIEEPALAKSALAALPKANVDYLVLLLRFPSPENRITKVIGRFKTLVDWVIAHKPLSVAGLDETLERCDYLLKDSITKRDNVTTADLEKLSSFSGESQDELKAAVSEIKESRDILMQYADVVEGLIQKLDGADFTVRLKKWVGRDWPCEEHEEPCTLAKEAIASPERLTDELMTWLCTAEARKSDTFLFALGTLDGQLQFVNLVVYFGAGTRGMENLASFLRGLYGTRPDFVTAKLDEFAKNEQVHGDVVIKATGYIGFSINGYERILKLLREGKAAPSHVLQAINSLSWIEGLNYDECARIMELTAAANLENATVIIDYLHAWSQYRTLVRRLTELAWSCLEAMPLMRDRDAYSFDGLASKLAKRDHERGLRLLRLILMRNLQVSHEEWSGLIFRWDPLSLVGPHKFWETLWEHDREGTLRFILQIASDCPESLIKIESGLLNVIDQEADFLLLATIARENEIQAELIARLITPRKPNFSQIAYGILECYPDNIRIHDILINSCLEEEAAVGQELLERLTRKLEKVESAEADTEVPTVVKPWLKKVSQRLKSEQEFVKNRLLDRPGAIIFRSSTQK